MILPNFSNPSFINGFLVSEEKILSMSRSLNPRKAQGSDAISVGKKKFSDTALATPLKIISTSCLKRVYFRKYGNMVG